MATPVEITSTVRVEHQGRLVRRTKLLAWGGIAYHLAEFAVALVAGITAGSIALIGFGADSMLGALGEAREPRLFFVAIVRRCA